MAQHNIDPTGLTQVEKAFAVVEGADVTYFYTNDGDDDIGTSPQDAAQEYADAVGGTLYEVTIEARIIAARRIEEENHDEAEPTQA